MKMAKIYCRTIKQAEYVLENYAIDLNGILTCPPSKGSYGRWKILYWATHKKEHNWEATIELVLYPTVIRMLFEKYGSKIEKTLVDVATKSKDKALVKHIWNFISGDAQNKMMSVILGGK